MSTTIDARFRQRVQAAGRWAFADRYGLVLWLALLCWFGLTWRIGFFIQDTYATANTLVALADGSLHVTEMRYSLTLGSQPGLHRYDGLLYGRNYGQLALAVPFVWLLEGLSTLVAPRLLLLGLWTGLGLVLVGQLSLLPWFDRDRTLAVGSGLVAIAFAGSLAVATDLSFDRLVIAAYQLSTLVAAATAGLVVYRLLSLIHGRRVGLAAGIALGVATPVGFWATIPKRHTLVALLTVAAVYAFAVSRHRTDGRAALRARAGAYALVGFVTSVHAFEALFLVVTLGVVDLLTAESNSPRRLLVVALVLFVAATPMLVTNYAISGNPAEPPRLLPNVGSGDVEFTPGTAGGAGGHTDPASGAPGDGSAGVGSGSRIPVISPALDAARSAVGSVDTVSSFAIDAGVAGLRSLDDPGRLYHTFVRSGRIHGHRAVINNYEAVDLALLEAMPLLGALAAVPILLGRRLRWATTRDRSFDIRPLRQLAPVRQTDLLVVTLAVVLVVIYLPRLPLYSTLTVRYVHPIVPLAAYGVARLPVVRETVRGSTGPLVLAAIGGFCLALAVVLGGISALDLAVGEAVQYHALWNLLVAGICAGTVLGRTVAPDRVPSKLPAVGLGLPAGFTSAYLVLSGLVYFRYGTYAFDLVAAVAGSLPSL